MKKVPLIFCLSVLTATHLLSQQSDFPQLSGPYLGQKPPSHTPEIFAPGIISTAEHEYGISFSIDLKEIYFKRVTDGKGKNLVYSCINNKWNEPEEVKFEVAGNFGQLHMTPDGHHLLANCITTGQDGNLQSTIVKFSRKNGMWGNPVPIGPGMRATSTESGSIYVTHVLDSKKSLGAIGRYRRIDDKYGILEVLEDKINHKDFSSAHPFIAVDESYLIFDSKREGDERDGLYISFNLGGKLWSKAVNLSDKLNTGKNAHDWYATVSPDGKYLFFSSGERGKSDIYWVSAPIIEELRPAATLWKGCDGRGWMSLIPAFDIGLWNAWLFMIVFPLHWLTLFIIPRPIVERTGHPADLRMDRKGKVMGRLAGIFWIGATLYSIFLPLRTGTAWLVIGLGAFVVGVFILIFATLSVARTEADEPFTGGIYRFSRHPMYLSMILVYAGAAIAAASWLFLLITVITFFLQRFQVIREEEYCRAKYGDIYRRYMDKTPRWIGLSPWRIS